MYFNVFFFNFQFGNLIPQFLHGVANLATELSTLGVGQVTAAIAQSTNFM
jgi:hypothetical protein